MQANLFDEYMTGVYQVRNLLTGKVYIGSSATSLLGRILRHIQLLRLQRHPNRYLMAAWNKYGHKNFRWSILERCAPDMCLELEQYWMDKTKAYEKEFGYNLSPSATSVLGVKHSEESRAMMSITRKGRKLSPEAIAKRTAKQKGLKRSAETKAKLSKANKGRKHTGDALQRMRESKRTPEYRMKVSQRMTGTKASTETRKKQSIAQKKRFSRKEFHNVTG